MTDTQEKLILDNLNLAYNIAWKYHKRFQGYFDIEDLKSIAVLRINESCGYF